MGNEQEVAPRGSSLLAQYQIEAPGAAVVRARVPQVLQQLSIGATRIKQGIGEQGE